MDLLRRLEKSDDTPTPIGIKIGVVVLGLLIAGRSRAALSAVTSGAVSLDVVVTLVSVAVYGVLLYAYWNMKRWALISLAVLAAAGVVRSLFMHGGTDAGIRAVAVGALIHYACLVPGFLAMRRR